jgi:pimeloyl-ACP methyl ester carboxylesterase
MKKCSDSQTAGASTLGGFTGNLGAGSRELEATRMLTVAAWVVGVLLVLYAGFLVVAYISHDRVAFIGAGRKAPPADCGFAIEDLYLPVVDPARGGGDGGVVHAWWVPAAGAAPPAAGAPSDTDPSTLVFFHGNGYPLEQEAMREAPMLREAGVNLLLMDYRGFGESTPLKPSGATTAADARAGMRHLTEERGIPLSRIWIGGRSIGSAVAVRLAAEYPGCAGLILITPITNTVDVKPVGLWLRPLRWLGLARDFDSRARIKRLNLPVLILAGTLDQIATPKMATLLHRRARGPKRLELFEGAGHNTIWQTSGERIAALIGETMSDLPPGAA